MWFGSVEARLADTCRDCSHLVAEVSASDCTGLVSTVVVWDKSHSVEHQKMDELTADVLTVDVPIVEAAR